MAEYMKGFINSECAITGTVSLDEVKTTADKFGFYAESFIDRDGFSERNVSVSLHEGVYFAHCHDFDDCEYDYSCHGTWEEISSYVKSYI